MRWLWMVCVACLILLTAATAAPAAPAPDPGGPGPYPTGSRTITTTNPDTGNTYQAVIYYPTAGGAVDPAGAPYAAIVFAHGFMASPSSYPGNAEHLASWGYIVALPDLPEDNTEMRQSDARHMFTHLVNANGDPASPFYGMVDANRLGVTGHSLGGVTSMITAARDPRVRAAVALDPTNAHSIIGAEPWDYEAEAPNIKAPMLVIAAPSALCNAQAGYNAMYDRVGAAHRTKLVVAGASHCDFMVTDNDLHVFGCTLLCGGTYDEARVILIQRYATAWFNYYLRGETGYYGYLYGAEADADVNAGRIVERSRSTQPRDVSAAPSGAAIRISWTPSDYTVIDGYSIYRTTVPGQYPAQPYAQVGRQSSYLDTGVTAGQRYYYQVRSRDAAGNHHAASHEVSAVVDPSPPPTATWEPSPNPTATEPPLNPTSPLPPPSSPTATETPSVSPTVTETPPVSPTATGQPTITEKARAYLPVLDR